MANEDVTQPPNGVEAFNRLRQIGREIIDGRVPSDVAARGAAYARRGAVASLEQAGDIIRAVVSGSDPIPYRTAIRVNVMGEVDALCTCPYMRGWCKHVVATIFRVLEPNAAIARSRRKSNTRASLQSPNSIAPSRSARVKTRRHVPSKLPPFDLQDVRKQVKRTLRSLDRLRRSDAYWHVSEVTHQLVRVRDEAEARFASGDIDAAFEQLGVLTDEMRSAWELLDDSDGLVADLAREIGGTWIRMLLDPDASPPLRSRYTKRLERWHQAYDGYGVGERFAAAVFAGKHGWSKDGPSAVIATKLDILEQAGDDGKFLALALRAGEVRRYAIRQIERADLDAAISVFDAITFDDQDVIAVAEAIVGTGHVAQALAFALGVARRPNPLVSGRLWINFDGRSSISQWVAENAERHGDSATALAAAEIAFALSVDVDQYRRLKRLSREGWSAIRAQLLERALSSKPEEVGAAIDVLIEDGSLEEALRLFDSERGGCGENTMWRLFLRAAEISPVWAAERAKRFADEIMDRTERSRYERAARWLRIVAFALRVSGRDAAWEEYRASILSKHKAKRALIPLILEVS